MLKKTVFLFLSAALAVACTAGDPPPPPEGPVDTSLIARTVVQVGFDLVAPEVTDEHFPQTAAVADVSKMLTVCGQDIGYKGAALFWIDLAIRKKGFRPATLAELFIYTSARGEANHPHLIALGSVWDDRQGHRLVPCLVREGGLSLLGVESVVPDELQRRHPSAEPLFLVVRR